MRTERLLQITSALCVALGTTLLGLGERDLRMALLAVVGGFFAVWLNDILGVFRLNRWIASGIAFIASLIAFNEALPLNSISSIRAIAGLLIYLELILLFQKKDRKIYLQLLVLSLLQVIVSALFAQGVQFGLLILLFLFVSLLDFTLLNIYTEGLRASKVLSSSRQSGPTRNIAETMMPFARALVRRDLFRQVFRMGIATLFLTMLTFFMLPRLGQPAWRSTFLASSRSVGFNDRIELGQLGSVINDPTEVMHVKISDPKRPFVEPITDEIYLHGTTLTYYEGKTWYRVSQKLRINFEHIFSSGAYHYHDRGFSSRRHGGYSFFRDIDLYRKLQLQEIKEVHLSPREEQLPLHALVQEILIEPLQYRELFVVRPYFLEKLSPEISYDPNGERLLRHHTSCGKRFSFQLHTTGISNRTQKRYYPAQGEVELKALLECPENIPTVVDTARKWLDESGLSRGTPFAKAMFLNTQLSDPRLFSYSLRARRADSSIDPIEDFVKNNPKGHCEYFATALAMMLRSQGIPSRLVVGFKCDEYDSLGKFFRVRQFHAHSWVEAYFKPEDMKSAGIVEAEFPYGVWYRFDPAPIAIEDEKSTFEFLIPVGKFLNWCEEVWNNYVMEMDRSRQDKAVYKPILNWFKTTYHKITDPEWWSGIWETVKPLLNPRNWNVEKWFSWWGLLIGVTIVLFLLVLFRMIRRFYRSFARRIRKIRAEKERRRRIEVEFYRRFLHVAAQFGLTRRLGETPREFAHLVGPYVAETAENSELEPLPSLITEAYYQVRFGQVPLDKDRQKEIELAVDQLETMAKKP